MRDAPSPELLQHFDAINPDYVTETPIATIWKVSCADGTPAAIKLYKDGDMQDEAPGFALQAAWDGRGAAHLYRQTKGAVLLEWLEGPSLGDMVRDGQDEDATALLGDVAAQLHTTAPMLHVDLRTLTGEFQALFTVSFADDFPAHVRQAIMDTQSVAHALIETQTDLRPLHRDLHHDNIKGSARGFLAFDAKGIIGERTFELANAFRNPIGVEDLYCNPDVIKRRLGVWSQRFDVDPDRLMAWANAYVALSLAWTANSVFGLDVIKKDPGGIAFLLQSGSLLSS